MRRGQKSKMGLEGSNLSRESTEPRAVHLLREQLEANLDRYLKAKASLAEAADFAEAKMPLVEESLLVVVQEESQAKHTKLGPAQSKKGC